MSDGRIDVQDEQGVRTLTINRPARRNALTAAMYDALAEGFVTGDAKVVLLVAAGESFCAGNDLDDFVERSAEIANGDTTLSADSPQARLLHILAKRQRPWVAAVDGAAIGIGFTALLHADLVVATPRASFGAPFGLLGLCPEAAASKLLPSLVGRQRALEIFLLGRRLAAEEAVSLGLVNRLVPPAQLAAAGRGFADALAALPEYALSATRALVDAADENLTARVDRELQAFGTCLSQDETRLRIEGARQKLSGR